MLHLNVGVVAMESRLADEEKNIFQRLPHELLLSIFNYNNSKDLTLLQFTSPFFNELIKDDRYWNTRHQKRFLGTPFEGDNKNQYTAAEMHTAIFSVAGDDKQQITAIACNKFIQRQPLKWSNYYRGLLLFNGLGVRRNTQQGFQYLLDALDNHDYRAALKIVKILLANKIEDPTLYAELMLRFSSEKQELTFQLLTTAYNKGIINIPNLLGNMHVFGICTAKNITKANEYFLIAAERKPIQTIMALARNKYGKLPNILSFEQKAMATILYLEKFKHQFDKKNFKLIMNYWRGYLAFLQNDHINARRLLIKATEIPKARLLLAHIFNIDNMPELAIIHLIGIANERSAEVVAELFKIKIRKCSLEETIQYVIDLTGCRKIAIADHVSKYLRAHYSMVILAEDPYYVWWLLLAAQANSTKSLEALLQIDPKETPYICLARAIIFKFGIFCSSSIEPDNDKAEYYFNLVRNQEDIKEYIQTARDHDFSCEEVMKLLESKISSTPRNKK